MTPCLIRNIFFRMTALRKVLIGLVHIAIKRFDKKALEYNFPVIGWNSFQDDTFLVCNLITQYNPLLPNIKSIIKKHLPVLHRSHDMLQIFPEITVNITYRRNKNLKELISPSLFPRTVKENKCSIEKCNRRCDICKNIFVLSIELTCHTAKRKYKIRGFLTCNTNNIIYLIACKCCGKQYIGSATSFKERFRIHKSGIITGRIRCGVASQLLMFLNLPHVKPNICKCNLLNMVL